MSIILVIYYTNNQPIDSNSPACNFSNWLMQMCNIIPLQQKPILDTHTHVHTCLLLRSYKVIHSSHCDYTNRQSYSPSVRIYIVVLVSMQHHIFCISIVLIILLILIDAIIYSCFKDLQAQYYVGTSEQMQLSKLRQGWNNPYIFTVLRTMV